MKKEENNAIPFDFRVLYTTRLILMMETAPQSGVFRQVQLTQEQFKKMSDVLYFLHGGDLDGKFIQMTVSDQTVKLPDTFQDFYSLSTNLQ